MKSIYSFFVYYSKKSKGETDTRDIRHYSKYSEFTCIQYSDIYLSLNSDLFHGLVAKSVLCSHIPILTHNNDSTLLGNKNRSFGIKENLFSFTYRHIQYETLWSIRFFWMWSVPLKNAKARRIIPWIDAVINFEETCNFFATIISAIVLLFTMSC